MAETCEVFLPNFLKWNGHGNVILTFEDLIEAQLGSFDRFITRKLNQEGIDEVTVFIDYDKEETNTPVCHIQLEYACIDEIEYFSRLTFMVYEFDMFRNFFKVVDEIVQATKEIIEIIDCEKDKDALNGQLTDYGKKHNNEKRLTELLKIDIN